jgi:two-component sensor histidine kinase
MKSFNLYLLKLGTIISILVVVALFYIFDGFIGKIASESLSNWLKVEEASILEGNLLTSVTKNQRAIYSSEFLKGFMLVDFSKPHQLEQISSGDPIDLSLVKAESFKDNRIQIVGSGFFKKYALAKIPNSESKVIVFSFWSEKIYQIFMYSCFLIFAVILFFGFLLARTKKKENEKALIYAEKAARVAHDIRSPLLQLSVTIEKMADVSIKEQLSEVSQRIIDITGDLILNRKTGIKKEKSKKSIKVLSLKGNIEGMMSAKKELYPDIEFRLDCTEINTPIALESSDLLRSISNLIENSIEACTQNGKIEISVDCKPEFLEIFVKDNGKGIPKEILPTIGTKGVSYGKDNGSGLGVYYAEKSLAMAGGSLSIDSTENKGTSVKLQIPYRKTRVVSNNTVQIESGSSLLILDDDPLVRKTWTHILSKQKIDEKLDVRYFVSSKDILNSRVDLTKSFLLTDYDLKENLDGLDIVDQLRMYDRAILVTGMAQSLAVQEKAKATGNVPILGKENLDKLNIEVL